MKKSILIVALALSCFLFLFLAHKINLPAADLGRHIKNGEVFLHADEYEVSRSALLHTNFFSYTYPDFPFINHHWGSGILAYLTYAAFGWSGISLAYITLLIAAFAILFLLVSKKTPLYASIPIALFMIPLFAERTEVRPEGLSYLFIAIFIYILVQFTDNKLSKKYLYMLPVFTILWINMHIYAIFSPLLIGAFLFESLLRKDWEKVKILLTCTVTSLLALLISPYGVSGALYPFNIFENYGYLIAENQSIPFLQQLNFVNPNFLWWWLSALSACFIASLVLIYQKHKFPIALSCITLAFGILGFLGIRYLSLFGLILLPFLGNLLSTLCSHIETPESKHTAWAWSSIFSILLIIFVSVHFSARLPGKPTWGLGLLPGNISSAAFVEKTNIEGPFFSNYDIGGFLIFNLYTTERKEKVFVDNRPETYPSKFFSDTYIPMQENPEIWKEKSEYYGFNAVWFYRLDATPWAQSFLISLVKNPEWAPIYVDDFTIIFLKRVQKNAEIIRTYELPQSMFSTR